MTSSWFDGIRVRWLMLAAGITLADQGVKRWTAAYLPHGASEPVTPFFNFVLVLNEGAAFGLLAGAGGWQRYFFIALALVVSAGLVVLLLRGAGSTREAVAYSLVLGGALGNVIDRMVHGAVVDYLDFYLGGWHWPAFNLADSAIVLGVLLLLWETALSARTEARMNTHVSPLRFRALARFYNRIVASARRRLCRLRQMISRGSF